MMPDRMGIIGSMQGVNASSKPKPKKLASTSKGLSDWNRAAISKSLPAAGRTLSLIDCPPGAAWASRLSSADVPPAREGNSEGDAAPAPPAATKLTSADCVCGT